MNNATELVYGFNMRVLFLLSVILFIKLANSKIHSDTNTLVVENNLQNSCEISQNNFNRSCIYNKINYLLQKLPYISNFPLFQVSTLNCIFEEKKCTLKRR